MDINNTVILSFSGHKYTYIFRFIININKNMSKNIHIASTTNGRVAKKEGAERASSKHPTQIAAIEAGRAIAIKAKSELLIHGLDGKIRDKRSYENDPRNILV